MPVTKLTSQQEYEIALEALFHEVKGISLNALADKHSIKVKQIEEILERGMNGFKGAFYGDSTGVTSFLQRFGVASNGSKSSTVTGATMITGSSTGSVDTEVAEDDEEDLTPDEVLELIREYNELVLEFNDGKPETQHKKLMAVTAGKIKEFTGMSQPKAKEWVDAHKKDIDNLNESFEVTADTNKRLKGFKFWDEYNSLKGE